MLALLALAIAEFLTDSTTDLGVALDGVLDFLFGNPLDGTSFFTINGIAAITFYLQAIALGIVVIMRVVTGVKDGIFANGGDLSSGETAGQWLFRSLIGIVVVCAMPTIFRAIAGFSMLLGSEIANVGTSLAQASIAETFFVDLVELTGLGAGIASTLTSSGILFGGLQIIIIAYYVITILMHIIIRQVHLVVLSLTAPLIAINSGTRNASDVIALLKEAISIGIVSGIQVLLLFAAMGVTLQTMTPGGSIDFASTFGIFALLIPIALFAAIKRVPTILEKYLPVISIQGSGSMRGAAMTTMYAARSLMGGAK